VFLVPLLIMLQSLDAVTALQPLMSHSRVRRDSFDDANWGAGDYYVTAIGKAAASPCTLDIYTRGDGQDYRVQISFKDSLTLDEQHAPESVVFGAPPGGGLRVWHITWEGSRPKLQDESPAPLPSLLVASPNADASDRLLQASRRAVGQCRAGQ
jgi:hypothetical protein